jgi:TonB family protein
MIRVLFNHILPFVLGCLVGVAAFYLVVPFDVPAPKDVAGGGSGSGICRKTETGRGSGAGSGSATFEPDGGISSPVFITSKPRATYTDAARRNNVEGTVLVKITFLASGRIGNVSVLRGLPDGLTEQAVKAARQIEFEPKKVNGVPVSVAQTFEYSFDIY